MHKKTLSIKNEWNLYPLREQPLHEYMCIQYIFFILFFIFFLEGGRGRAALLD